MGPRDLPAYQPKETVTGTIRLWGSNYIVDGNVGQYWEGSLPEISSRREIRYYMLTTRAAVPCCLRRLRPGMGRAITDRGTPTVPTLQEPRPLNMIATGSYNVTGWQPAFGIVVSKDNPLPASPSSSSTASTARNASAAGSAPIGIPNSPADPRKPPYLGPARLTGDRADQPITPYGLNQRYHQATEISDWILQGSDKWNERLRIYANYVGADDGKGAAGFGRLKRGLNDDLIKDRYGIAYVSAPADRICRRMKVLEVAHPPPAPTTPTPRKTSVRAKISAGR